MWGGGENISADQKRKGDVEESCPWGDRMKSDDLRRRVVWIGHRSPGVVPAGSVGVPRNYGRMLV